MKVIVYLGAFAWDAALRLFRVRPKPKFGHGTTFEVCEITLIGCYHPSQQNTFTGVLKPSMMDEVFRRSSRVAGNANGLR